jgi:hypothetical protein
MGLIWTYPLVMTISLRTGKWPTEIVDLPTNDGDFPFRYVRLPEGR